MGRRAQGYAVRQPSPGASYTVRFRVNGVRRELSTGTRDRTEAEREARRLYAEALSGKRPGAAVGSFRLTTKGASAWLASLAVRPQTYADYEDFTARWIRRVRSWDDAGLAAYIRERLREARAKTVRTEVSALRGMLTWLAEVGEISESPLLPSVPRSALGVPSKQKTRVAAPELSRQEIRGLIARLPDKASKGWWVRPRCELLYETGLRPSTIDALSVPEHWAPGSETLNITTDIDKEGFARELPLTPRALAILERCAPEKAGVIFGRHKYYRYIRKAAQAAADDKQIPKRKADVFTGQHLRSARATHILDAGAELTGAAYLLGHNRVSTTARYIRASKKAAAKALKRVG